MLRHFDRNVGYVVGIAHRFFGNIILMPAPDHFGTYQSARTLRPQPPSIARRRADTSRKIFKRLFIVITVIVFGVFLFSIENTAKLLTEVTASMVAPGIPHLTGVSQPQSASDLPGPSIARSEPIGNEDRVPTPVEPSRPDVEAATSEVLLRQFEAWAAEQDAQRLATAQQDQDHPSLPKTIPERAVDETTGSTGRAQKNQVLRSIPKARTKMAPLEPPTEARHTQNARVQAALTQRKGAKFSQASGVRNQVDRD